MTPQMTEALKNVKALGQMKPLGLILRADARDRTKHPVEGSHLDDGEPDDGEELSPEHGAGRIFM